MPIETPEAPPNWTGLEGTVLEGGYEIESCLKAEERFAYFKVRVLGDRFTNAVAEVYAPGSLSSEELSLWRDSEQLRHPNLSSPLSAGELDLAGSALPYRVLVKPDETLGAVIQERALTAEETREVLTSLLHALEYLHGNGFTDSGLAPDQILAIGDSIKLSTAGLRRINTPVNGEGNPSPATDVYLLGSAVFAVLTQRPPGESWAEDAAKLPYPFDQIVQRCLDPDPQSRCTLPEVRALLNSRNPEASPTPIPPVAATPVIAITEPRRRPEPEPDSARPPRRERWEPEPKSSPFKNSALLLLALLVAVGVLWLTRSRNSKPRPTVNPGSAAVESSSNKPANAIPTRVVGPDAGSTPNAGTTGFTAAASGSGGVWRVVSFTYNRKEDAEKKAAWINSKHPGFHPEVFSPDGKGAPYLVTLGGRMTREEALKVKQRARSAGLPRDSYVQNYSR